MIGQAVGFTGYGGIEDPDLYMKSRYGDDMRCIRELTLPDVPRFSQAELEPGVPNCVLAAILRVVVRMRLELHAETISIPGRSKWVFSDRMLQRESLQLMYPGIRAIAVKHGYDPAGKGMLYDLVRYPPWCIGRMLEEALQKNGYAAARARNRYWFKRRILKREFMQSRLVLMNLAFGDYPSHTVTACGLREYAAAVGTRTRVLVEICDGWSDQVRYLDLDRLTLVLWSVTTFS